jgi:hypothetical protein
VLAGERDRELLGLVPTTRREFARSDEIWLQAPPSLVGATAHVLRDDGSIATEGSFDAVSVPLRLPLSGLVPGNYFLELTGDPPDEDARSIAFRVR